MKVKKILVALMGITLLLLGVVYVQFQKANQMETETSEEKNSIRVIAPYEVQLHQQILISLAKEYSRGEGKPEVVFEFVPEETIKKELSLRRLTDREKADIVICSNTLMPELIQMGILKELPVSEKQYKRVRKQQLWNSTRDNGKYYGVPLTCDPYILYYKKDWLENRGGQLPKSWGELVEDGENIQRSGVKSIGIAGKRSDDIASLYYTMLYSMGGNLYNINNEKGQKVFQLFQDMSRYGLITKDMMNYTQEDLAREFAKGQIQVMVNQMSAATILKTSQVSFEIGMAPLPFDMAGSGFLAGENIGITVDADVESQDFLQYLVTPQVYERFCDSMDTLPVFSDVEYQEKSKFCMENATQLFDNARFLDTYASWTRISEVIAEGIYEVIEKEIADPRKIAENVYDQVRVAILSG